MLSIYISPYKSKSFFHDGHLWSQDLLSLLLRGTIRCAFPTIFCGYTFTYYRKKQNLLLLSKQLLGLRRVNELLWQVQTVLTPMVIFHLRLLLGEKSNFSCEHDWQVKARERKTSGQMGNLGRRRTIQGSVSVILGIISLDMKTPILHAVRRHDYLIFTEVVWLG